MKRTNLETSAAVLSNTLVYGLNGIYSVLPLYLGASGFSDMQSGYLLAINPFVMCFSPVIWGRILDRCRSKNVIMSLLIGGAAVSYLGILLHSSFYWAALMLFLYSFFQAPFNAVIDTLTVGFAEKRGKNYGVFRVMGTIGYGILCVIVTLYADISVSFVLYAVVAVLAIVSTLCMMHLRGGDSGEKPKATIREFRAVLNAPLVFLITLTAVTQFVWGVYVDFYPGHLSAIGYENSVWGWFSLVTAYAEIPFFLLYSKLFRKLDGKAILSVSLLLMVLRFLGLLFLTEMTAVFVMGFLTGAFVTVVNYCMTVYVMQNTEPKFLSLTQNVTYSLSWGIPRVLAGLVGGYMMTYLGFQGSMAVCVFLLVLSLLALIPLRRTLSRAAEGIRPSC